MSEYDSKIGSPWKGYYLSAYGIAVKHGFRGTEKEWLESLAGRAAELDIIGAVTLPYGSAPTVTEQEDSTTQDRRYAIGIPEGKPGGIDNTELLAHNESPNAHTDVRLRIEELVGNVEGLGDACDEILTQMEKLSTGKLDAAKLDEAIKAALEQAKENGDFDGGLTITSDGEGNIAISTGGTATITSDGEGNVTIR